MWKLQLYLSSQNTSGTVYQNHEKADSCREKEEIAATEKEPPRGGQAWLWPAVWGIKEKEVSYCE